MSIHYKANISKDTMLAMLDYMQGEIEDAQTTEDLATIFEMLKVMLSENATVNVVRGLTNIRAELDCTSSSPANVATNVPSSLVSTFYDLSEKMNQLHVEDPELFQNASKALHWLANGETKAH